MSQVPEQFDRNRLFIGICLALVVTATAFSVVSNLVGPLKEAFILDNFELGLIGGAALWGMAISQILLGPFAELSLRRMMQLAFGCHLGGTTIMLAATFWEGNPAGFWPLFIGAAVLAFANGITEVAGNPMVTSLYPEQKTEYLNKFHVWFPGGILISGILAYGLNQIGAAWEWQLAMVYVPAFLYGYLLLPEKFPQTESARAGISVGKVLNATFSSWIFWVFLFSMLITASLELGTNRWIPPILTNQGLPGILVLAWINGIMAVMRYYAEPVVDRYSPTLLLLFCSVVSGAGLLLLSFANSLITAFLFATIFAVGISFFWPTMLGSVSERVPESGAVGMGLLGGAGMLMVGAVTIPLMGQIIDQNIPERLPEQETVAVIKEANQVFQKRLSEVPDNLQGDVKNTIDLTQRVLDTYNSEGALPPGPTADALRSISSSVVDAEPVQQAGSRIAPAEAYGGRMSFRWLAPFAIIIIIIFGILHWRDVQAGGYQAKALGTEEEA